MQAEADARTLKLELGAQFRLLAQPVLAEQRAGILSAPSQGRSIGRPIRSAIAESLVVDVRFTTMSAGVKIRSKTTAGTRNFTQAPRRFNQKKGTFRHPVFGNRANWVSQESHAAMWFTNPALAASPKFYIAAMRAMDDMRNRILARARAIP